MSFVRTLIALPLLLWTSACVTSAYSTSPYEYSGVRLYQVFCSSCHGLRGHGDGPVQPFVHNVPDLTKIAARNSGQFPRERVRQIIDGRAEVQAHGTRQMPVWGFEFYGESGNDRADTRRAEDTVDRLVKYLETIQPGYFD